MRSLAWPVGAITKRSSLLFLLIVAFCVSVATLYLSRERYFYSWDYAIYPAKSSATSQNLVHDPAATLRTVYLSTLEDYNDYFTLPLAPFMLLFKQSRLGYVLGVIMVYYIPFLIVTSKVARVVLPDVPGLGWIAVFVGLATPSILASIFRGYPDVGASLLMASAVLVYARDIEFRRWKSDVLLIGTLTALAIVFRRHFAYSGIALFACIGIISCFLSARRWTRSSKVILLEFRGLAIRLEIALVALVCTLLLIAPFLFARLTSTNFINLYSSYSVPPAQVAALFEGTYRILWLPAVLGLIAATYEWQKRHAGEHYAGSAPFFVLVFGIVSFAVWVLIPRQLGLQYTLHLAVPIIVGVSCLIAWVLKKARHGLRGVVTGVSALVLCANLWAGLAPNNLMPVRPVPSYPPLYRTDYDEVIRLVTYLRQMPQNAKAIYVVDSSQLMNRQELVYAEEAAYGDSARLSILYSPDIDSRDTYPLESLLQADTIIVTTPFQHHLPEEEQRVAKFVFDIFTQGKAMSQDFRKMPEEFQLQGGNLLTVYERKSATSFGDAIATFALMKEYIPETPGSQTDWMPLNFATEQLTTYALSRHQQALEMRDASAGIAFLYMPSLAAGNPIRIHGEAKFSDAACAPIPMALEVYPFSGQTSMPSGQRLSLTEGTFSASTNVLNSGSAVVLRFGSNEATPKSDCKVNMDWTAEAPAR